ncbi:hypothetical protein B0H66DRAFT_253442 [Apodospora peruviana]|uniref:DUF7730 domain-containing protein n=1 Tax=Apodospora peruviana TaxID=516989 RepID=A0AAE0I7B0_9PEZI|nr:hypothetical protein B0H66DRAFT_253442 [Apodospora peruviana]
MRLEKPTAIDVSDDANHDPVQSSEASSKLYDQFAATADSQTSSAFFQVLPSEIRQQIYVEFWRIAGPQGTLRQHIIPADSCFRRGKPLDRLRLTHIECITDSLDEREAWLDILNHTVGWTCLHMECDREGQTFRSDSEMAAWAEDVLQRAHPRLPPPSPSPSTFLPVLLSCKLMYLECLPSIYSTVAFTFSDLLVAGDFLLRYRRMPIRAVELTLELDEDLVELYYPPDFDLDAHGGSHWSSGMRSTSYTMRLSLRPPNTLVWPWPWERKADKEATPLMSMEDNPWARVCDLLANRAADLHELRITLSTPAMESWPETVSETRLLAKLRDMPARPKHSFLLVLPRISRPWSTVIDIYAYSEHPRPAHFTPERFMPDENYLEGEDALRDAPFCVLRGLAPVQCLAREWDEARMDEATRDRYWAQLETSKFWPNWERHGDHSSRKHSQS